MLGDSALSFMYTELGFFNGPNPASFLFIFVLFSHCKVNYSTNLTINDKSVDGVHESRTQGDIWKAQTNPLSYGGTPTLN